MAKVFFALFCVYLELLERLNATNCELISSQIKKVFSFAYCGGTCPFFNICYLAFDVGCLRTCVLKHLSLNQLY